MPINNADSQSMNSGAVGRTYQQYRQDTARGLDRKNQEETRRLYSKLDELTEALDNLREDQVEERKAIEKQIKAYEKDIKAREAETKAKEAGVKILTNLKDSIDNSMKKFIESQESMAYNLHGTSLTLSQITTDLKEAVSGRGVVRQEKVYENLTKLVSQGIVNNVEQRAYLETLAQDLDMVFNYQTGSLNRLIRLQQSDLSSHRMAIEASLKEFLNQNFQTSEYIREGFANVSQNLLEAQSLMSGNSAVALESVIQKWMGALNSVGFGSTDALSQALGYLGSGNLNALAGSPLQNLLVMGAARTGLSYGDLINNGLTAETANTLISGIVSYIGSMSGSNVVKSEYARIFGLSGVSDIAAVNNISDAMMASIDESVVGSSISELLNKTDKFVYATTKIENLLSNFVFSTATGVAGDANKYLAYRTADLVANVVQGLFGEGGGDVLGAVNLATNLVPLALLLGLSNSKGTGIGQVITGITGTIDSLDKLFYGLGSAVGGNTTGQAFEIYKALGGNNWFANNTVGVAGNLLGFGGTGLSVSGSAYMGDSLNSNTSATTSGAFAGVDVEEGRSINDVYNKLTDAVAAILDLPNHPFGTVTRIAEAGNTVSIGQDSALMQDMATYIAMNVQNIYSLLVARFTRSGTADVINTDSMNWNHPFNWMTTTIGG